MRLVWFRTKNALRTLFALVLGAAFVFAFFAARTCRLAAISGERSFYLDSASSQSLCKNTLSPWEIFRVRGESVCCAIADFDGGRYANTAQNEETVAAEIAQAIAEKYGAEWIFSEEVCGVTSFYGYSERLAQGVRVNGARINLHVAVRDGRVAVGTPIIFGGF